MHGPMASMYRSKKRKSEVINYQEAAFAWKGRILVAGSSNKSCQHSGETCSDREKKYEIP